MRVLLLFVDGVGIGPADPGRNPFFRAHLPTLRSLLGGMPSLDEPSVGGGDAVAFPLDASLGVEGLPQSGTGQTSLLTGVDTVRLFGRHFGPWPPVSLRPLLAEKNLLVRALERGRTAAFANAYPPGYASLRRSRLVAAPPLAAAAAGLLDRHADALARGEAVSSEITNDGWRERLGHRELPEVTPREAGRNLAGIAARHDVTLYAHYATDLAGHRGGMEGAVRALERVDAFLSGILEARGDDLLVMMASDHGNVEDVTAGHTRNPALGMLIGPAAERRREALGSITDVAGAVLEWVDRGEGRPMLP